MITRRKFLSFLAAVLPAAWVSIDPMGRQATTLDPKKFKNLESTGTWVGVDLAGESDRDLWEKQLMGSWDIPVRDRFSHIDDAYQYMVGARRPKFDNKNYGTIAYTARFQRELNMRRSKVLDIISRKA